MHLYSTVLPDDSKQIQKISDTVASRNLSSKIVQLSLIYSKVFSLRKLFPRYILLVTEILDKMKNKKF